MGIKYSVNEKFFDVWTPVMAYVLGYLYADGSVEDASYLRGKYMRVTSVDKHIIVNIRRWLGSKHTIVPTPAWYSGGRMRYLLRIGSHRLYDGLMRLGIYPNKSLTVRFPDVPDQYLSDFVRGYFDGDGCVFLEMAMGKRKKRIVKKLATIFTSGSKRFLEGLRSILEKRIALGQDKIYNSQRAFQLRCATSDSIKLFKFLYKEVPEGAYFERKFKIFARYFALRPITIDKEVQMILNR